MNIKNFYKKAKQIILAAILAGILGCPAAAKEPDKYNNAYVSEVLDGDTVKLLIIETDSFEKVRLLYVDAPENKQTFGYSAKQLLKKEIEGKTVKIRWAARDKYNRILGELYRESDNYSVNYWLVKIGAAWPYTVPKARPEFHFAKAEAQKLELGLWKNKRVVEPQIWRKKQKEKKSAAKQEKQETKK